MEDLETQPTPEHEDTPEPEAVQEAALEAPQTISIEEWTASNQPGEEEEPTPVALEEVQLLAVLEACVYVAEEPLMPAQIAAALNQDPERIKTLLQQLMAEFERPEHGVSIKEVAGGYKMATKPEHHEAVRSFVKSLKAPLKLSLPALETLAVVAYKQPVTSPEIMEIRGVQGGGVLKTLLDRKLITEAGRKNVIGKPILYKTTKEFLIQFGLKDLSELPTLKEFEEIRRMAFADNEAPAEPPVEAAPGAPVAVEAPVADATPLVETPANEPDVSEVVDAAEADAAPAETQANKSEVSETAAEAPPVEAEAAPVAETQANEPGVSEVVDAAEADAAPAETQANKSEVSETAASEVPPVEAEAAPVAETQANEPEASAAVEAAEPDAVPAETPANEPQVSEAAATEAAAPDAPMAETAVPAAEAASPEAPTPEAPTETPAPAESQEP